MYKTVGCIPSVSSYFIFCQPIQRNRRVQPIKMRLAVFLLFTFVCVVAAGKDKQGRRYLFKRDVADTLGDGRQEIAHGNVPAKDYIVIEILKPLIHYFAAEAHKDEDAAEPEDEA